LTLPYGFGNLIPCLGNPQHHPWSDATDLRISPTPLSFSRWMSSSGRGGASAFSFTTTATLSTHVVTLSLMHTTSLFYSFLRSSTRTTTATSSAASSTWRWWRRWRWTRTGCTSRRAAYRGSSSSVFVDGGHCIGMGNVSNASATGTLLCIFIQQIQLSS